MAPTNTSHQSGGREMAPRERMGHDFTSKNVPYIVLRGITDPVGLNPIRVQNYIKNVKIYTHSAIVSIYARQPVAKLHLCVNVSHHPNVAINLAFSGTPKRSAATATSNIAMMQSARAKIP